MASIVMVDTEQFYRLQLNGVAEERAAESLRLGRFYGYDRAFVASTSGGTAETEDALKPLKDRIERKAAELVKAAHP